MVVSTAFGELAEVLHCLEATDVEVRDIAVEAGPVEDADEITADLRIGVPVLQQLDLGDDVSIAANGTALTEEKLELSVSVTVPAEEGNNGPVGPPMDRLGTGPISTAPTESDGTPAYKDPDALAAVYEEYDSFPEMTEALGVDVTPETVRRYMVKHDIHDPEDTPGSAGASEAESSQTAVKETETDASESSESDTSGSNSGAGQLEQPSQSSENSPEPALQPRENSSGKTAEPEESGTETSMADVLAGAEREEGEDTHLADGLGIPRDLSVAEFVTILQESRTVYEVGRQLDMEYDHARRFLERFDLRDLVTGRLTTQSEEITAQDVYRRLGVENLPFQTN